MQKRTKLILAVLLPIQIIALQVLKHFPNFIETYYSTGLFPYLSRMPRFLFGWVPFSIGDIFYLLIAILALRWMYKNRKRIRKDTLHYFIDIVATFSIVYFVFNLLWGLNYYRVPLHQTLNLNTDYTTEQLISTTKRLSNLPRITSNSGESRICPEQAATCYSDGFSANFWPCPRRRSPSIS